MILSLKPLSIAEAAKYAKNSEEKKPIHDYFKNFGKADLADAESIREKIASLDNIKIKEAHIVKIIDILPQDSEEVHKIFGDVNLSEEEVNAILNLLKK